MKRGSAESSGNRISFIYLNTLQELTSGSSAVEDADVHSYTYIQTNKVTRFIKMRKERRPSLGD